MKKSLKNNFFVEKVKPSKTSIILFCAVLALCIIGCVMVYSASSYAAQKNYGNQYFFLTKQILGVAVGLLGLLFFYFFDCNKLKKLKWPLVIISAALLGLVFIPGIGVENYGAKRWISILGFSFQPSELAKFSLVLFCD